MRCQHIPKDPPVQPPLTIFIIAIRQLFAVFGKASLGAFLYHYYHFFFVSTKLLDPGTDIFRVRAVPHAQPHFPGQRRLHGAKDCSERGRIRRAREAEKGCKAETR